MRTQNRLRIFVVLFAVALSACCLGSAARPAHAAAAAPLIVIDPGHGGPYSNANANRLREKNVNLQIAAELATQLKAMGYRVILTRCMDTAVTLADIPTWTWSDAQGRWTYARDGRAGYVGGIPKDDLQARADIANVLGADLFISIHNNGAASRRARGTETWASPRDPWGRQLSGMVQRQVVRRTKLRNRGAFATDFYVMRWSNMPALLVEGAFITNTTDARLLRSTTGRWKIARGVADGVAQWFATRSNTTLYPRTVAADPTSLSASFARTDTAPGPSAAVIARASDVNAVLTASTAAATLGGPLLLAGDETTPGVVPTTVETELARLRPKRVIVAGVSGAFDPAWVERYAESSGLPTSSVEAVTAADVYELSTNLARATGGTANVSLARAGDLAAMTQAVRSFSARTTLLLIPGDLTPSASAYLAEQGARTTSTTVFGSSAAIPDAVVGGLPGFRRVAGERFQVAAAELYRGYSGRAAGSLRPIVVNAADPVAQALASVRASRSGQPVVMVSGQVLSAYTREWITNNRGAIVGFLLVDRASSLPVVVDWMLWKAECS